MDSDVESSGSAVERRLIISNLCLSEVGFVNVKDERTA